MTIKCIPILKGYKMSYVRPVSPDEHLSYLYKHMEVDTERKLENFNGRRKISVYRGKDYMNKITKKLDTDPPMTLIRQMRNVGTKEEPKLATQVINLTVPKADILLFFDHIGDSLKGITLNLFRRDFEPVKKNYANFAELKADKWFMDVLGKLTKRKLI